MSGDSPYLVTLDEGIKTITFNQPKRRNPISSQSAKELIEVVNRSAQDGTRVLVFTGAGGAFSAGADLMANANGPEEERLDPGTMIDRTFHSLIRAVTTLERPVIAAVDGVAAGFGFSLAVSSDIMLASERSTFSLVFVNIALTPDGGLSWALPRRVGMHRAMELAFTGRIFNSAEAKEMGLVNHVYPADRLMDETNKLAKKLAAGPVKVMGIAKREYYASQLQNLDAVLAREAYVQGENMKQPDFSEGVSAFFEKRKPNFS